MIPLQTDHAIMALVTAITSASASASDRVLVLTSDHGVALFLQFLAERRLPGGRLVRMIWSPIRRALESGFGSGQWILGTVGTSPYLNQALMAEQGMYPATARTVAANAAAALPQASGVYTGDQLLQGTSRGVRLAEGLCRAIICTASVIWGS